MFGRLVGILVVAALIALGLTALSSSGMCETLAVDRCRDAGGTWRADRSVCAGLDARPQPRGTHRILPHVLAGVCAVQCGVGLGGCFNLDGR